MFFFKLSRISKTFSNVFIGKDSHIREPVHFKPMLFKGQLYIYFVKIAKLFSKMDLPLSFPPAVFKRSYCPVFSSTFVVVGLLIIAIFILCILIYYVVLICTFTNEKWSTFHVLYWPFVYLIFLWTVFWNLF